MTKSNWMDAIGDATRCALAAPQKNHCSGEPDVEVKVLAEDKATVAGSIWLCRGHVEAWSAFEQTVHGPEDIPLV